MTDFNPYITFDGHCEEALDFYKECFHGEILFTQYYGESPKHVPEEYHQKIMHSEFKAGGIHFMACDNLPGQTMHYGNNVTFNVTFDDLSEQEEVFKKLSEGGNIYLTLQDTFWGSKFGMLTDRFGIHWMLNCDPKIMRVNE